MACQWFSAVSPISSTNKTDCHDITEILLKVALNTITPTPNPDVFCSFPDLFHYGTGEGSQGSNTQLLSVCPGGGGGFSITQQCIWIMEFKEMFKKLF